MEECSSSRGAGQVQEPPPNQMGMSLGPFSYPFAQERHTANATGQEPTVYNTLDLDSYNLGKSELSSSFLDLLSGRLHHPPNETRLPYSASALAQAAQLQVRHGGSSVSCDNPATSIPPSSKNHGGDAIRNEEFSPFVTSKASPLSRSTNDPYLLNNFQVEASNCHSSAFGKPVSVQASQGSIGVAEKSSRTLRWPSASSPSNARQQHMLNQITRKMPLESRPSPGCRAGIGMSSKTLQLSSSSSPSIANHQHRLNQSRPSIQGSSAGTEISSRTLRWPSVSGPSIQGSSLGTETSSRTLMWPSASSPSNANRPHVLNQGIEKMTSEVKPPLSNHSSSIFRGRPRVFCMNKAGELFVSDMGHFGVICFCHGQPMSVKMFSEHSGSPSANPGEAVHLENGMTIAQWRRLFSGVMASDRGNGWDWSNSPSPIGGLLGSKPNNLPTSSQNSASINSLGTSGGLGNSGEQRNKFVFPDHTHTELGELTVLEKSVGRGGDHGPQSGLHGHSPFTKNFSISAQSTLPALAKNHMVQDIQKSPTLVGFDGPCLNLNQGQHDAWPQLVANNITNMREKGNLPISFSSSGMKNSFNYGNNIRRGDFPSKTLLVDQDGPSNIELRLGHSSQKNNTFTSSSPAAMRTLHIGAVNLQKSELCQSLTCRTEHPRETKKSWFNLQRTPSEMSSLHRQSQHSFGSNMLNHSESELIQKNHSDLEVPTDDATKNSLISFLSHLGTGGNCSSNSTDTICNRGKELTRVTSGFCGSSKHNYLVHASDACGLSSEVAFLGNMDHHGNATHESASPFRKPTSRHASLSSETPNLRDGSLKSTSLRHLERSLSSHENPLLHRRFCCLSDVEQQRNVVSRDDLVAAKERNEELYCITQQAAEDMVILAHSQQRNVVSRDDLVAAKERNKGLFRITQHDAEDTAVKTAHSLSSCYSGGEVQILAVKPDSSGLYNCFDCSASSQRLELCPKEHGIHLSSGHICHVEQPFQRCSLNKLTGSNKHAPKSSCSVRREENEFSDVFEARNQSKIPPSTEIDAGSERHTTKKCSKKCLISRSSGDARSVTSHDDKDSADELRELNKRRPNKEWNCQSIVSDSKASCCVCGDLEKEDVNQLLECNNCLIRVHQACYGIAKAPKGRWCCRPCKTNSLNTVCVLCGYGNGAMTRALKSQNAVNSLLMTWKLGTVSSHLNSVILSERTNAQFLKPDSVGKASEIGGSVRVTESVNSEVFPGVTLEKDLARVNTVQHSESVSKDFQAYNSIIAGMLDPSVAQWVHMVCGLWTPGTRCPNVDTMSTFDVSGASHARKNCVCSLCNRPGGSCIVCRVPNCSVLFHPWCAHQKGLLQSETEGDDNKKVGFYGRCMDHATCIGLQDRSRHADNGEGGLDDEISTCARTEGFKGRKKDEGFDPIHQKPCKDGGPCIVSEEQKNAWLHINRKKPCTRRVVRAPSSDLEYDVRKEYIRYKQSKGWKYLVVYKSGIHALGLYTSQFIIRGAMVVEYVGEIVGLRVADKREIEYQSGRRLQYKSACYFFRIDKEHIIDATRKGGIARFVNHSCRPNCAAKVISVRNEKKVVFFAERDIYQGEEITYDYHFNHEDEGQKIPCLCNSTNCRHYLN